MVVTFGYWSLLGYYNIGHFFSSPIQMQEVLIVNLKFPSKLIRGFTDHGMAV